MKKTKLLAGLLAAALILPCFAKNPDKDIVILYTNDVHCGVENNIGYAGLSLYKQEMLEETPYVSLVDAGDALQGAQIGQISKGGYIITLMNEIGYDVAIPGNHEFDYGMQRFLELSKKLKCGYIACNFYDKKGKSIFPAYKILTYGDTKVAFVGVCTPETLISSNPVTFQDKKGKQIYDFGGENDGEKMIELTQKTINEARQNGADFVILLAHLGEKTSFANWSAMHLVENTSGADALIDGHSHEITPALMTTNKDGKSIPVTQTGTKFANIGKLTITTDGELHTELLAQVPPKNGGDKDPVISAEIKKIKGDFESTLNKKIGYIDFEMPATDSNKKWLTRNAECSLGDFITDGYKSIFKADIAMINGGGIRAGINKGDLTLSTILDVHPFGNKLYLFSISGQAILDELEFGAKSLPGLYGGFLHVSGLTYKIDTKIPSSVEMDENGFFTGRVNGQYRVHDVYVNGQPLDVNKIYKVVGPEFVIQNHGDGHLFKDAKILTSAKAETDCNTLIDYIKTLNGKIPDAYRQSQNRIVIEK